MVARPILDCVEKSTDDLTRSLSDHVVSGSRDRTRDSSSVQDTSGDQSAEFIRTICRNYALKHLITCLPCDQNVQGQIYSLTFGQKHGICREDTIDVFGS